MDNYDDNPRSILDDFFYRDIANTVCSYLYVNCCLCDTEILQEHSVDGISNNFYCSSCIQKPQIKKCHACNKFYNYIRCPYPCPVCIGGCVIYCRVCFTLVDDTFSEVYDNMHINYYWTIFDRLYHDNQHHQHQP